MARRRATRGNCQFCGKAYTRWGMTRHLETCAERASAIESDAKRSGKRQEIFHLLIEDVWTSDYWLHLEIAGQATLDQLDLYLRAIWLECCGHLSHFLINGIYYDKEMEIEWAIGETRRMSTQITAAFELETEAEYKYDFGTPTELLISALAMRSGIWTGKPIRMLARNNTPTMNCTACSKKAEWICIECLYENRPCLVCDRHVNEHSHVDDMILPVVNSPRIGMCGYEGPAEPPY
ncbi:MAG: hypothetical protein OXO50_05565 [Caldilineaceae bacterium]|nr:hypothetical protein [Caldilineaceae bacterium]